MTATPDATQTPIVFIDTDAADYHRKAKEK